MFEARPVAPESRLTSRQRLVVILMDLLLLAELTWAVYLGQQDPENSAAVFLRTFLPAVAVTLIATRVILRKMQPKQMVSPGAGPVAGDE